jgi:PPOX class probable F420-dependent enzyme
MPIPTVTTLPDHIREFLAERRFASIATVDEDGTPRQAVIWYLVDGDEIVVNSLEGRRWPTNLRRDPRVSIAVTDARETSWVGISGLVASVIDDQAVAQADIAAMARFYHADEPATAEDMIENRFRTQPRVSFRIRPVRIHDHLEED